MSVVKFVFFVYEFRELHDMEADILKTSLEIRQAKLQYWAGLIHECQNSGINKKEWLASKGIHKDTYYYWYKKVQSACVEAMELATNEPTTEFVELPGQLATPVLNQANTSSVGITIHVGNATIDVPETTSMELIQKLIGALAYVK